MPSRPRKDDRLPSAPLFEPLEERLVLYSSGFFDNLPALTDMQNTGNTVVRIATNEGNIDIELYDKFGPSGASAAPITTANFLNYVNSGRYDLSFFHRFAQQSNGDPFVLQGGGFTYTGGDAPPREEAIPTDATIQNEFDAGRSNIAETLAIAKIANQPDSGSDQFFFNLGDNAHAVDPTTNTDNGLDVQDGGFTVFAHVIKGWDVVQTITALQVRDSNAFLTGVPNGDPSDIFTEVPVTGSGDADFVIIEDAKVIKPAGSQQFFSQSVYFPDGFRSGNTVESIEIANPDPNAATPYQIIAHFEDGRRDTVIFTNTLAPGAHIEIPIAQAQNPALNKVRGGDGFSYEIRSAHSVAATLHHKDFGAWSSEAFVSTGSQTASDLEQWNFANGLKGDNNPSFLVFQNLTDTTANVDVLFYPDGGGTPFFISQSIDAMRRGGFNINELPSVPDGAFSIEVFSDQPIVATLSQYTVTPGAASSETGVVAGGSTQGVLPGAYIATGSQSTVSALFTGATPSVVTIDFDFILSDGTVLHSAQPLILTPAVRRRDMDLASAAAIPLDTFFTIRYRVRNASAPVTVSYTGESGGDTLSASFQTFSGDSLTFAGGLTFPAQQQREIISLYNPFQSGTTATYRLKFHFVDGDVVASTGSGTLAAGQRVDVNTRDLADIMSKISSGSQFRHYSVTVETTFSGTSTTGAIFAQLTRFDVSGDNITTGPTWPETVTDLTDPLFQ